MRALKLEPMCVVEPEKKAMIDSSLRLQLGYEIYYFSSRAAMLRFQKEPLRYSGPMTDPITKRRFKPTAKSPRAEYLGRTYYFSADSTRTRFLSGPEKLADRHTGAN